MALKSRSHVSEQRSQPERDNVTLRTLRQDNFYRYGGLMCAIPWENLIISVGSIRGYVLLLGSRHHVLGADHGGHSRVDFLLDTTLELKLDRNDTKMTSIPSQ